MQVTKVESSPTLENLPCLWVTAFNFEAAQFFCQNLFKLDSNPAVEEIFVYVSSPGGDVFACLAMIDAMKGCRKPVSTITLGMAGSCGAALAICGTGTRFMAPNAFLHIHRVSGGTIGDVVKMESDVKQGKVVDSKILGLIAEKSNLTKKDLLKQIRDKDKEWRLLPKEAMKYEFVDVIGVPKFSQTTIITAEI